jgi:hypothetical protein
MSDFVLKAGAAVCDINPITPQFLCGYPHVPRMSTGVHDPLLVSALYVANGKAAVLQVALDILFLDPATARSIRAETAGRLGLPEAHVFISCTHTHSAPITNRNLAWEDDPVVPPPDPAYMRLLRTRILEAAEQAARNTRPAELAWTVADATGVGGNRLSAGGLTDPEVGILAVRGAGGGPMIGVSMVYGMHPTVLHEDSTLASADFPGYARLVLQETWGRDLVVVYHTGPEGNQSPRHFVKGQTFAEAERLGRMLGGAVKTSLQRLSASDFRVEAELAGGLRDVMLTRRHYPSVAEAEKLLAFRRAELARLRAEKAGHGPVRTAECALFGAEEQVTMARAEADGRVEQAARAAMPAQVQALRLGDACLGGLPGEVFAEYALDIKKRAARRTFVACLVNGELQGYIVTPEAAAAGGYEAANSLFLPESGRRLADALLGLIAEWAG